MCDDLFSLTLVNDKHCKFQNYSEYLSRLSVNSEPHQVPPGKQTKNIRTRITLLSNLFLYLYITSETASCQT